MVFHNTFLFLLQALFLLFFTLSFSIYLHINRKTHLHSFSSLAALYFKLLQCYVLVYTPIFFTASKHLLLRCIVEFDQFGVLQSHQVDLIMRFEKNNKKKTVQEMCSCTCLNHFTLMAFPVSSLIVYFYETFSDTQEGFADPSYLVSHRISVVISTKSLNSFLPMTSFQ